MDVVGFHQRSPFVIVGKHRATVAVAAHGFGGEERGGGDVAEGAGFLVADAATKALGTVFQDIEVVFVGHLTDGLEVGWHTEEVDGDDHTRRELACFQGLLDLALKVGHVDVEGVLINVDEDGRGALHGDDLGRGEEGEAGNEDGVAGFHVPGFQSQQKGIGAAVAGDAVLRADIVGEGGLHLLDFRAHDVGRRGYHVEDGLVHFVLEDGVLGF